jgi:hypothetical protein
MFREKGKRVCAIVLLCVLIGAVFLKGGSRQTAKRQRLSSKSFTTTAGKSGARNLNLKNLSDSISLLTPRRNHGVLIMDKKILVNIAGRGISNIETFDTQT